MSKPLYETAIDIKNQERMKRRLEVAMDAILIRTLQLCMTDYVTIQHYKLISLVEIKVRTISSSEYNTYMLSKYKADACVKAAQFFRVPFILAVEWTDKSGYVTVRNDLSYHVSNKKITLQTEIGKVATEPCIHIPINQFIIL